MGTKGDFVGVFHTNNKKEEVRRGAAPSRIINPPPRRGRGYRGWGLHELITWDYLFSYGKTRGAPPCTPVLKGLHPSGHPKTVRGQDTGRGR